MSWAQLPPELLLQVILHAYSPIPLLSYKLGHSRQLFLLSLCLVNQAWGKVARDELYRHVCLGTEGRGECLLETFQLEGGEELRGVVRSIRVKSFDWSSPTLVELVLGCSRLEELSRQSCRDITFEGLLGPRE